jgi:hypothetical protein
MISMGNIRPIDRRREPRREIDIRLFVWGVETKGERFLQEVRALDISLNGALLTGVETELHSGDVIGILYLGLEARFRVVWVHYDQNGRRMQAAVQRVEPDSCPWQGLLTNQALARSASFGQA